MQIDPKCIGGSSAASVLGVGYESRLALWERLRGDESRCKQWTREERRRLDAGTALEPLIVQAVRDDYGVDIMQDRGVAVSTKEPNRIVGHPDGWISPEIGAELKTVGSRGPEWGEPDSDHVPSRYLLQCMHYMMLTGAAEWHLFACRVPSWRVDRYIIRRDEALCDHLLREELKLLAMVDSGERPDPADEEEARRLWFAHVPGKSVAATPDVLKALTRREIAGRAIKVLEDVRSRAAYEVLMHAQEAEVVQDLEGAEPIARLSAQRTFDVKAFMQRYPELASKCLSFDRAVARELDKKAYDSCMRAPTDPRESVRQIRLTKQFKEAIARLAAGEPWALPYLPEIAALASSEEASHE